VSEESSVLTCVDLFAGGGGLTLGLERAGFEVLLASDIEGSSARTFESNKPEVPFLCKDLRRVEREELLGLLQGRRVDLVAGGPPCQGFSTMGDQLVGDARNALFWAFRRVVQWTDAPCFLMENVSYLRSQYEGRFEDEICRAFEELGYRVRVATLNAADFGVPQIRRRVFFFGTRSDRRFEWPRANHSEDGANGRRPWRTVGPAIMDLVEVREGDCPTNHVPLRHGAKVLARYKLIPEGGRMPPPAELPEEIRRKNFGNTYKRLHRARPSLTLVPGNNAFPVHPTLDRSLTPREAARLQTFPDSYEFAGNRAQQCKLVGNAVPVELGAALGVSIAAHLRSRDMATDPPRRRAVQQKLPLVPQQQGRTAVSFFTGIGGMLLGFEQAGFTVRASYDRKTIVNRNMQLNFPGTKHFHRNVLDVTPAEVREAVRDEIEVVFGGSPCQGFSIFGRRRFTKTKGHRPDQDPRNALALAYIDLAVALNPRAIVLENVKGITSTQLGDQTYVQVIERRLRAAGYDPDWRILNCADYGVPQLRERFILVAMRDGLEFRWPDHKYFSEPKPWQRGHLTVGDVITDLMDPTTVSDEFSHVPMNHKPLVVERYKLIPEGGRLPERDLPEHLRKGYRTDKVRNYSHVYKRLAMDRPATTMVPGHNAFPVHPRLPRSLTVREAARIQTFPDSMRFVGTRQQQCMLVGNAVPPVLATALGQALLKALDEVYADPGYKRDIYDLRASAAP